MAEHGENSADTAPETMQIVEPLCAVFRRALKAEGLKYTPERARILDTIMGYEGVFEADRLIKDLRHGGFRVSKATVYRTFKLLQDAGVIQRVPIDQEQAVFQLVYGTSRDLVIRLDNNQVIPVRVPQLDAIRDEVCRQLGVRAQSHRLLIFAVGAE